MSCTWCEAAEARYRCTQCGDAATEARYCGTACQRAHWLAGHHELCAAVAAVGAEVPIGAALRVRAGTTLRPMKGSATDDDVVLDAPLGAGGVGTVWSARRGDRRFVAKLFDLNNITLRREFVKEVYAHRLLARLIAERRAPTLCRRTVRCAAESFVDTRSAGRIGVLLARSPLVGDPFDLGAFAAKTLAPLAARNRADYHALLGGIATDLIDDVATLHENGFVHRDLKPGNVLVDQTVTPKTPFNAVLIDLGSMRPLGTDSPAVLGAADGTPLADTLSGIEFALSAAERRALKATPPRVPAWLSSVVGGGGTTALFFDPRVAFFPPPRTDVLRVDTLDYGRNRDTLQQLDEFAVGATLYAVERGNGPADVRPGTPAAGVLRAGETTISVIGAQLRIAARAKLGADASARRVDDYIVSTGVWRWAPPNDASLVLNGVIQQLVARTATARQRKPLRAFAQDVRRAIAVARTPPPKPPKPAAPPQSDNGGATVPDRTAPNGAVNGVTNGAT